MSLLLKRWVIRIAILAGLYTQMIKPNTKRREQFHPFKDKHVAHRGLHDNSGDAPENSMPAFRKAVQHGFGIELDVQMTKDGKLVVFHDASLRRMCGVDKRVSELTYHQLQKLHLADSKEKIPLFRDVLKLVNGRVPLVVEIKYHHRSIKTAQKTAKMLKRYKGFYVIESFHPGIVLWYRIFQPDILRGQLSSLFRKEKAPCNPVGGEILANLLTNFITKPDFIAYNHRFKNQLSYRLARKLYKFENVAWTIKSQKELDENKDVFHIMIFDSFIPENK